MERTKSVLGTEKLEQIGGTVGAARPRISGMALSQLNRSSGPVSFGYSELENNNSGQASILTDFASQTTPGVDRSVTSIRNELKNSPDANKNSPTKRKYYYYMKCFFVSVNDYVHFSQHWRLDIWGR